MSKTKDLRLYESKLAVGLYAPYDLWIGVPHRRSISHRIIRGDLEIWLCLALPFDISLHFTYNTIIMEGCPSG